MPKYVECMGGIWRLSERKYKLLLKSIASDVDIDMDVFGKLIVPNTEKLIDLQEEAKSNSWCRKILDD